MTIKVQGGLAVLLLFIAAYTANAQFSNKFDLFATYSTSVFIDRQNKNFTTDDFGHAPSLLGNLKASNAIRLGFLYSDISFRYQPGFSIGHKKFTTSGELDPIAPDFSATSIGIINKFNLLKYGHFKIVPYVKGTVYINMWRLNTNRASIQGVEQGEDPGTIYSYFIAASEVNRSFVAPSLEISLGVEKRIFGKNYLLFELSMMASDYPDIDTESPAIHKEMNVAFGFQHKFLRNKRFY